MPRPGRPCGAARWEGEGQRCPSCAGDAPPAPGLTSLLPELEVSWELHEPQTAFFH